MPWSLSYQNKNWYMWPHQSFFWYDTDFKIMGADTHNHHSNTKRRIGADTHAHPSYTKRRMGAGTCAHPSFGVMWLTWMWYPFFSYCYFSQS